MQELETANRGREGSSRNFFTLPAILNFRRHQLGFHIPEREVAGGGDGSGERSEFSSLRQSSEETHPRGHPGLDLLLARAIT